MGALTHDRRGGHKHFPAVLGLPVEIAHLLEAGFEGTPRPYSRTWTARAIAAIPVGADLRGVPYRLALWIMGTEGHDAWASTTRAAWPCWTTSRPSTAPASRGTSFRARSGPTPMPARSRAATLRAIAPDLWPPHAAGTAALRPGDWWPVAVADHAACARVAHLPPTTARQVRRALRVATGDRLLALLAAAPMASDSAADPAQADGPAWPAWPAWPTTHSPGRGRVVARGEGPPAPADRSRSAGAIFMSNGGEEIA